MNRPGPPAPLTRARRGALYEAARAAILGVYRLNGWRVEGDMPADRKMVVIAAPHTTNWDLPLMLAVAFYYRVDLKWMGKDGLFKPPFGGLMRALGGIPIDRSKSNDVVSQMVDVYAQADDLLVAIPPEGTRAKTRYWKTGFYHIADGAGVPIALGFLDYPTKTGGVGGLLHTTGDYGADLEEIKAFYAGKTGKHDDRSQQGGPDAPKEQRTKRAVNG